MEFSIETLKRKLKEIENDPLLGKFVRQQYVIQKLVSSIIFYSFVEELSSLTLGKLIDKLIKIFPKIFQSYKLRNDKDALKKLQKDMIKKLQEYNERRKNLIHHQDQIILQITEPYKEIENEKLYLEETLKLGEEIKTNLFEFLKIIFKNQ